MELHLASMENVACWAFRKLCRGATDSYTGMQSASYLIKRTKAWKEVDFYPIEGQRQWLQLLTSRESEIPEFLARLERELAAMPEKSSLYGIQLNLSCPSPNVCNVGQGSALIKRPTKVVNLIKELLKQDKYKVGVKIRLGMNLEEVKQRKIIALLSELEKIQDPNFTNVTIHFKHSRDSSKTPYDFSLLPQIAEFKLPIIINGGISSLNDFNKIMNGVNTKNIRGFMIARECLRNPDCFVPISNSVNQTTLKNRTPEQIKSEFEELIKIHEPRDIYLRTIREYCPWAK